MLKTRTWIILLSAVFLCALVLSFVLHQARSDGTTAQILLDGEVIRQIDLSHVDEPYSFTVMSPGGGTNRIEVEPGRIRVVEANCPDGICVSQGWLSNQSTPIVCLPHRLIIKLAD